VLYCISALHHHRNTVDSTRWRNKIIVQRGALRLSLALGPASARAGPGCNVRKPCMQRLRVIYNFRCRALWSPAGLYTGSHACRDCGWHIILVAELYTICPGERVLVATKFNVIFLPLRLVTKKHVPVSRKMHKI